MTPLRERILKRGLLAAVVMAVVGFVMGKLYLAALQHVLRVDVVENEGINYQGPLIFALTGFAIVAAAECIRRK